MQPPVATRTDTLFPYTMLFLSDDEEEIRSLQSLLRGRRHAGGQVVWRDNQPGCKRVCDGLAFESVADATDPALCDGQRCFDEILLSGLQARLVPDGRDRIVVLHMLGNHAPAYYQRYPPAFPRLTPTSATDPLGPCARRQTHKRAANPAPHPPPA